MLVQVQNMIQSIPQWLMIVHLCTGCPSPANGLDPIKLRGAIDHLAINGVKDQSIGTLDKQDAMISCLNRGALTKMLIALQASLCGLKVKTHLANPGADFDDASFLQAQCFHPRQKDGRVQHCGTRVENGGVRVERVLACTGRNSHCSACQTV